MNTTVDPPHTALLVMDYQNGIIETLNGADALLDRAAEAIATIRLHNGHIGCVRVAFDDADYDAMPATSAMAAAVAARQAQIITVADLDALLTDGPLGRRPGRSDGS